MAWVPIPIGLAQGNVFSSGRVLKTFLGGTTTPTNMATDSTGGTTTATVLYDSSNLPTVSGSVVFPHIDTSVGLVKYVLYPSQAAADANSGALYTWDNIGTVDDGVIGTDVSVSNQLGSAASGSVLTVPTYVVGSNNLMLLEDGVPLVKGSSYDYTETTSTTVTLTYTPLANSVYTSIIGNATVTSSPASANAIAYTQVSGTIKGVESRLLEIDTQLFYTDQTVQTLTGPGAVNLTAKTTHIVTTGADALTLADGSEGQEKFIVMKTDGGAGTLTPSNLGNGTTITFDDVGDSAHLLFTNGSWHFMGGTATLA